MGVSFKFVHAADLHLDRPISGLADIPSHLKSTLVGAAYESAERVFDLAIAERVDFLLLAGDVVDLNSGGPRTIAFLLDQFQRLAEQNIGVYWCSGSVDPLDRWPAAFAMPPNVTTFSRSPSETVVHRRGANALASIIGCAGDVRRLAPQSLDSKDDHLFTIFLGHGEVSSDVLPSGRIRYWALGGRHRRKVMEASGTLAVYPGTIQGRSPAEAGAHGCTIVHVNASGQIRHESIDVDAVRWLSQSVEISHSASLEQLVDLLSDRCLQIQRVTGDRTALVQWNISPTGEFDPSFAAAQREQEILQRLRSEFGQVRGGIWSVDLEIESPKALPAGWSQGETILGEFLRLLENCRRNDGGVIDLEEFISHLPDDSLLSELTRLEGQRRQETLNRVQRMALQYLLGETA